MAGKKAVYEKAAPRKPQGYPTKPQAVARKPLPYPPKPLPAVAKPQVPSGREYAERLVQSVIGRKARIAEQFYAMGVELGELARPQCYRALGFGSFVELIEGRKVVSRMTALRLMSVAEAFPRELAVELGLDKAYALVRYAEATPVADVARVLAERDAIVGGKGVREASTREIEAETKRIRSGGKVRNTKDPAAVEARGAAREIQKALRKVGRGKTTARAVWEHGEWWVRIEMAAVEARTIVAKI